jgi:hypothetical protein
MYALLILLAGSPPPPPDITWHMTHGECVAHAPVRHLQLHMKGHIAERISCPYYHFPSRWFEEPIPDLDTPPRRPGQ